MHALTQIRNAVVAYVTGLATTGSNVFEHPAYNIRDAQLPALVVALGESQTVELSIGPQSRLNQQVELTITALAKNTSGVAANLEAIAAEVETELGPHHNLGIGTKGLELQGRSVEISADGSAPIGALTLSYLVRFMITQGAPETLI